MDSFTKETVIIVHGTWAAPKPDMAQWYQPDDGKGATDGFVRKLNIALWSRGSAARCWAHCDDGKPIFYWSQGENSWIARTHAATALAEYVHNLQNEGWRCHLVAHSHGGNVVVEALAQISAASKSNGGLGKVVTIGTPFMDTLSPIRKRAERQANWLRIIGWGIIWVYVIGLALNVVILAVLVLPTLWPYWTAASMVLILFFLWRARRRSLNRIQIAQINDADEHIQPQATLLAIGCPTDEAWQVLHHLPTIDAPLAVKETLLRYLVSSVQSQMFRLGEVARIRGAKSFRDIGIFAKCVAGILDFYIVSSTLDILKWAVDRSAGTFETEGPGSEGLIAQHEAEALMWQNAQLFAAPVLIVLVALAFRPFLGAAFYSAIWSPFRWCAHLLQSLASVGPALVTYFVRRWSWPVLLRLVMGLENYGFNPPPVTQFPSNVTDKFVRYENMPKGAEQRALRKRSEWISRHLGSVSQTFAGLAVSASDVVSLLRTIEADQTLVHAAYYTDDECIARIADWIAGRG
ncbi:hypothetical protein [Bradyrhizobium sp. 1(2017)]|uniref:hypothetical protein n=1 Tax=Bradyrhizobium sp. 1(2017) TaxID=1404888 RepID=UPI00140EE9AC|nr:hypothetical protein [Bradyrhizobium sp. 1(2017)]QIO36063.1 hypothetical protein HAP40_31755 [Bradyrhizobium sp. 1(2017)]